MTQTEQFDADVVGIEPEGSQPFLYKGVSFICQRNPIVDKLSMVENGFEAAFDFAIDVRNSQFTAPLQPPSNLDTIAIADVDYCIVATTPDQFGVVNTYAVKQKT